MTLTEELALKQAAEADKEIAAGKYRGPLHGIPWVAKDLIAYPGYKTTWGAGHFKDQTIDAKATVAERLEEAGAVLVAKTTLGALAQGDLWFGGMTRNPWNIKQGSSGSSAGTASAVAAGLVAFGIGSETLGSIVSPSTRCGVTGLRPTFGRVSRAGCMTLSWSLDKLGPMARSRRRLRPGVRRDPRRGRQGRRGGRSAVQLAGHEALERAPRRLLREHLGSGPEGAQRPRRETGADQIAAGRADTSSASSSTWNRRTAFDDITRAGVNEGIGTGAARSAARGSSRRSITCAPSGPARC